MGSSIAGAYKRKEYGWFFFYIFALIVGVRLWGIAGAVGGTLIAYGLYGTIKNANLSVAKKILFSIGYIIGGVVATFVILTILKFFILYFFGIDFANTSAAKQVLHSTNASTSITLSAPRDTGKLETVPYSDPKSNFQIRYPKGYNVSTDEGPSVAFDDPNQTSGSEITVRAAPNLGNYTLQEYAAGDLQGFERTAPIGDVTPTNVQVLTQGPTSLNGEPAYVVEFTYNYESAKAGTYTLHVKAIYMIHDGTGYAIFGTNTWDAWQTTADLFAESAASFKFLK